MEYKTLKNNYQWNIKHQKHQKQGTENITIKTTTNVEYKTLETGNRNQNTTTMEYKTTTSGIIRNREQGTVKT